MDECWHQREPEQVVQRLKTDAVKGLSLQEAEHRKQQFGHNELIEQAVKSPWLMIWEQLSASTIVILLVAALMSALLGDYKDTIAILAIVVLTTLIGFSQEYRTGKALAALKRLAVPKVKVCRDGHQQEISARELVPGDLVLLEAGNLVPADGRILESMNLRIQESTLTGEAVPIDKVSRAIAAADIPLGDRHNMVYMGTSILYGRGRAVITATGMDTELGTIAHLVQAAEQEPTPLQQRLDHLGQKLVLASLALVAVIFGLGVLRGESLQLMFLTAVSMAVAVVPEGLPAIVTIALAIGAQRMLQRQVLIRKLPAVETLGSVTVICADKTGTLTENRMTVNVLDVAEQQVNLETEPQPSLNPSLSLLLTAGALCNDATFSHHPSDPSLGDPTEVALVVAAVHFGLHKDQLEQTLSRIAEIPFDSDRKRMTTVHRLEREPEGLKWTGWSSELASITHGSDATAPFLAFTKGAVSSLLDISTHVWVKNRLEPLDQAWYERILTMTQQHAQVGTRVLGVAFRRLSTLPEGVDTSTLEQDFAFIGVVGMTDPVRSEVKQAVQTCKTAGIRPVLITGDHPLMAQHIAQDLGIVENDHLLTGTDLHQLTLEELSDQVESISVYARVSPEQKLKIVQALQHRGHIVAMTGDGGNDAPALRKADIGVAMGVTGTDVAKAAADMVLLDDNFATIVAAAKEGRVIYDNIRKCIKYLLSGNAGEIWVMVLAPFLGMPLPLLPIQILWINLMADGLPALALGVELAEPDTMHRPPYAPTESVFGRGVGRDILWIGLVMGVLCLGIGYGYWRLDPASNWQTMLFTILILSRMGIALAVRSERDSLFQIGILSNRPLLAAVALTVGLQLAVVYIPALQSLLQTHALSGWDLGVSLLLSTIVFWVIELQKWFNRRAVAKTAIYSKHYPSTGASL